MAWEEYANVFQLWEANDQKLPFKVVRWSWNGIDYVFEVTGIAITYWPYGYAEGRFIRKGIAGEIEGLRNAGSYQWRIAGAPEVQRRAIQICEADEKAWRVMVHSKRRLSKPPNRNPDGTWSDLRQVENKILTADQKRVFERKLSSKGSEHVK